MSDLAARIEREFHDTIWNAANDWMRVERAICEARELCYLLKTERFDLAAEEAERWLDAFGRDTLREGSSRGTTGEAK